MLDAFETVNLTDKERMQFKGTFSIEEIEKFNIIFKQEKAAAQLGNGISSKAPSRRKKWGGLSREAFDKLAIISAEDLKLHYTQEDCWTCYDGIVYDITAYLDQHPGGKRQLMSGAGIDCTREFNRIHYSATQPCQFLLDKIVGKAEVGFLSPQDMALFVHRSRRKAQKQPSGNSLCVSDMENSMSMNKSIGNVRKPTDQV